MSVVALGLLNPLCVFDHFVGLGKIDPLNLKNFSENELTLFGAGTGFNQAACFLFITSFGVIAGI